MAMYFQIWVISFLHIIKKNQLSSFFLGRNVQQRLSSIEADAASRVGRLVGLLLEPACLASLLKRLDCITRGVQAEAVGKYYETRA
jgi:hypothetical protein